MNNSDILSLIDTKVKGHIESKKVLLNTFNKIRLRHYQINILGMDKNDPSIARPSNVLLVGKSGTGKTYLINKMNEIFKFPMLSIDATKLTLTGAAGGIKSDDLEKSIIGFADKFHKTNKKMFPTVDGVLSQMVVFVDEFDKLGNSINAHDWMGTVQANFLKVFESNDSKLEKVTWIFAGAFMNSGIYQKEIKKRPIGFFNTQDSKEIVEKIDINKEILDYGIIPELLGRIGIVTKLDELTHEDYKSILTDILIPTKDAQLLYMTGEGLNLSDEDIDEIVSLAMNSEQGIRYMDNYLSKIALDLEIGSARFDFIRL